MKALNDLQFDMIKGCQFLYDTNDLKPDYIGIHEKYDAAASDTDWLIYKFTYSGDNVTKIQKREGIWDDRASLF